MLLRFVRPSLVVQRRIAGPTMRWSSSKPNPHRKFYKSFGIPLLKVFLGSIFTFQLGYWSWLKLESIEIKVVKSEVLSKIEAEIRAAVSESTGDK